VRHAVFTIVQDEPFFFPLWHKYYRGHYEPEHMYVLYHPLPGQVAIRPDWLRVPIYNDTNLVRVFHDKSFDHTWLRQQVERFAAFLLGSYDTVTFTEVDEILTPDPTMVEDRSLTGWLDAWCARDKPTFRCTGYEVVHRFDSEPDLDPHEVLPLGGHVLRHRGWWYESWLYSKALVWRVPPRWDNGFHTPMDHRLDVGHELLGVAREEELLLLHLHKVDYKIAVERWKRTAARDWNEADRRHPTAGAQNRFRDEGQLRDWWYRNIDNPPLLAANLVPMPAAFKDVV
jgi:hypothetical protein